MTFLVEGLRPIKEVMGRETWIANVKIILSHRATESILLMYDSKKRGWQWRADGACAPPHPLSLQSETP